MYFSSNFFNPTSSICILLKSHRVSLEHVVWTTVLATSDNLFKRLGPMLHLKRVSVRRDLYRLRNTTLSSLWRWCSLVYQYVMVSTCQSPESLSLSFGILMFTSLISQQIIPWKREASGEARDSTAKLFIGRRKIHALKWQLACSLTLSVSIQLFTCEFYRGVSQLIVVSRRAFELTPIRIFLNPNIWRYLPCLLW